MGSIFSANSSQFVSKTAKPMNRHLKSATFALGCFWHPDALFGCQKGVYYTRVGYTGGTKVNPTYRNLGDHTEAIDIEFDPEVMSYENLLSLFWKNHDPTAVHKRQYRSAIFYRDDIQKEIAAKTKEEFKKKINKEIVTAIEPFHEFYNAEDYHQKYYLQTHHRELFTDLHVSKNDLVQSEIATKLNGFVVGENTKEAFDEQCSTYNLSAESISYLYQMIKKGKQAHC